MDDEARANEQKRLQSVIAADCKRAPPGGRFSTPALPPLRRFANKPGAARALLANALAARDLRVDREGAAQLDPVEVAHSLLHATARPQMPGDSEAQLELPGSACARPLAMHGIAHGRARRDIEDLLEDLARLPANRPTGPRHHASP